MQPLWIPHTKASGYVAFHLLANILSYLNLLKLKTAPNFETRRFSKKLTFTFWTAVEESAAVTSASGGVDGLQ